VLNLVLPMIGIAAAGQAISYALAIMFVRRLGPGGFEAYAVAAAVFTVMIAVAPAGIDKFSLRILPATLERQDWSAAHGFLRYGAGRIALLSFILAGIVGAGAWWWRGISLGIGTAILWSCLALPAGALAHFGMEVLSAVGRAGLAAAIIRLGVPVLALASFLVLAAVLPDPSGATAIASWALAWYAVLVPLFVAVGSTMPPDVWRAEARKEARDWSKEAALFWVHRVGTVAVAQAGVIALEVLDGSSLAVGAYAAAVATTMPAVVLVTATNRVYARGLSIQLERGDLSALSALRQARLRWLVPTVAVFLFVTMIFAEQLMALFGPDFVAAGATPLRILAASAAFSMVFALRPTYLKFTRRRTRLLQAMAIAAIGQFVLLVLLVPSLAATGAALAYAFATLAFYGTVGWMARRDVTPANARVEDR
jgi:O-antigen/teichoic acid export membrane protein